MARRTRRRTLPGTRHHVDHAPAGEARPGDRRRPLARTARRTDRRSRSRPARRNAGPDPSDQRRVRHRCPPVESPFEEVERICDNIVALDAGRLVAQAPWRRSSATPPRSRPTRRDRRAPRRCRCARGRPKAASTSVAISTASRHRSRPADQPRRDPRRRRRRAGASPASRRRPHHTRRSSTEAPA